MEFMGGWEAALLLADWAQAAEESGIEPLASFA